MAGDHPENQAVFGCIVKDQIVSFCGFIRVIDNIWEIDNVRTHPQLWRQGHARTVLTYATALILENNIRPLYNVDTRNIASVALARSCGYAEVLRKLGYTGFIRD